MNLTIKAQVVALLAHAGQKYGDRPFVEHTRDVATKAQAYGFDEHVIIAAWLHATLEDCPKDCPVVTLIYIKQAFGLEIANLVFAVTDEAGKNRRERAKKTLPKIRDYGYNAVGLKLCDRLSNVESAFRNSNDFLNMYKKEYTTFKKALYIEGEHEKLWKGLDQLLTIDKD